MNDHKYSRLIEVIESTPVEFVELYPHIRIKKNKTLVRNILINYMYKITKQYTMFVSTWWIPLIVANSSENDVYFLQVVTAL